MEIRITKTTILALSLIVIGIALRILPHTANIAPVGAIALFAGAILSFRTALWLPLLIMVLSDLVIGLHPTILYTWGGFVLIALLGTRLRGVSNWLRVPLGALGASLLFFVVSNFGVWMEGRLYPATFQGLIDCYAMALPFLRNSLIADLGFSVVFFGLYSFVEPALRGNYLLRLRLLSVRDTEPSGS
jgi:hypothetical protein